MKETSELDNLPAPGTESKCETAWSQPPRELHKGKLRPSKEGNGPYYTEFVVGLGFGPVSA